MHARGTRGRLTELPAQSIRMEDANRQLERRKFFEFAEAIAQRVSEIAAKRGSTARSADVVVEDLFKSLGGDATKVTDDQIEEAFDRTDKVGD